LDGALKQYFDEQLHPLIESGGSRVVIDLSECKRITSAGITLLVTLTARANLKGNSLAYAGPTPYVMTVFEKARLDRYFDISDTVEAAIRRVTAGPSQTGSDSA
jgi:anti-anti-sigma factor